MPKSLKTQKPDHAAAKVKKHGDHNQIEKRVVRYVRALKQQDLEAVMSFISPDVVWADISHGEEGVAITRDQVRTMFEGSFEDFYDIKFKTRSIHGHKNFTAWEWEARVKNTVSVEGEKLEKGKSRPHKMAGCSLMWWDDEEKIVKYHEYIVHRDPKIGKEEDMDD